MTDGDSGQMFDYPLSRPTALESPVEWMQLRRQCPVARVKLPSGDEALLLTRYDDVRQVLSDPRFYRASNADDAARIQVSESGGVFNNKERTAIPQRGEGHQRLRRMIGKWFTVERMNALRSEIEAMAERLVDDMMKHGQPADLQASVGFPLPFWAICGMLGVPDSDRDKVSQWSDMMINLTRYTQAQMDASYAEFTAYMAGCIAAKRAEPGDDLLSELITTSDSAGEWLSDAALLFTGQGLLASGHASTSTMIGKMVAMLLVDRRRWEQLLADRSLVRTAVEEVLRYDANLGLGMPRHVAEEAEVSGTLLSRGTTVICEIGAANRDESAFDGADDMDLSRSPNPHLAFGAGPHSCIGQPLARSELQAVLDVLLRKLPSLDLAVPAEGLRQREGLLVGGLTELPVRW